jgi:hypothetical protein
MYRKLICSVSFVLVLAYFAGQVGAASMGMDGYADRVVIRDDGSGNALWFADASGPGGFGDGVVEVSGGAFGLMTDVLMLGDVSGDGIADRVFARAVGDSWIWVADYSTATGFGDGLADADVGFGGLWLVPHAVVDLDGDGIADRVGISENCWYWGDKGPAGGGFGDAMADWGPNAFGDSGKPPIGMADLNNDGLADRVRNWWYPDAICFAADFAPAGGGFGNGEFDWAEGFGAAGMLPFVGDVSADGYGDRIVAYEVAGGTYTWEAALTTPTGFGLAGIPQEATFGAPGDILLLSDVLLYLYCEPPDGDVNRDCIVDFLDIAIMAEHWLEDTRGI